MQIHGFCSLLLFLSFVLSFHSQISVFPFLCLTFHILPQACPEKQACSVACKEDELKSNLESEQSFPV